MPPERDRLHKNFALAIGLFSGTLALLFFLQSSLFSLQTVQLTGNVYLRETELLDIGGITYGHSIFNIDLRNAKHRLSEHAQIESVRIVRRLPATIVIDIVEREPVAIIPVTQGFAALDVTGRVLRLYEDIRLPLPLLTGLEPSDVSSGSLLPSSAVHDGLRIASALKPDLVALIAEIEVSTTGIVLLTRNSILIQLGNATQLDDKLATLRALLKSLSTDGRKVERIDLRTPRTPVLR